MDINFKCSHCEQELTVDAAGAGSEIQCPACGGTLVIPAASAEGAQPHGPVNAMSTSAAAKEHKHFAVPQRDKPADPLITKPLPPLEVAAKEGVRLRIKSIKRSECMDVGKDHFDEVVTAFLDKIGEASVVSISTFNYTHQDLATRQWVTDYGAFIVYRG
jgi:DNA-directed RNA polymerase subunit RPC12/RpoP